MKKKPVSNKSRRTPVIGSDAKGIWNLTWGLVLLYEPESPKPVDKIDKNSRLVVVTVSTMYHIKTDENDKTFHLVIRFDQPVGNLGKRALLY